MIKLRHLMMSIVFALPVVSMEQPVQGVGEQPVIEFKLPQDKTTWQQATLAYLGPVLKGEAQAKFQELLDLTMPTDGNFDEVNAARREQTIIGSYKKLQPLSEDKQMEFLTSLMARHRGYVGK